MISKALCIFFFVVGAVWAEEETRIAGGSRADIKDFPYQVSLQTKLWGRFRHFCGAAILTNEWIITAGHCIKGLTDAQRQNVRVVAGSTKLSQAAKVGQIANNTGEFFVHPDFKGGVGANDIAVFKIQPLEFNDNVQAIKLPDDEANFTGTVIGSGWGSTHYYLNLFWSNTPDNLRKAIYKLAKISVCRRNFGKRVDPNANLCIVKQGFFSRPSSVCNGDSGGPLVQNGTIVGIVSWGNKVCGVWPSVLTRVAHYVNKFIKIHVTTL